MGKQHQKNDEEHGDGGENSVEANLSRPWFELGRRGGVEIFSDMIAKHSSKTADRCEDHRHPNHPVERIFSSDVQVTTGKELDDENPLGDEVRPIHCMKDRPFL